MLFICIPATGRRIIPFPVHSMLPLFATRGHPKRQDNSIHQFIISPIEAHSKKPDEARDKIVRLMGDIPRVELFARQAPPGWDVWGNEVNSTINLWPSWPEVEGG